ncbi:MAG: site-2 protease family protein [Planctomycetota bacterium]
MTSLLSSLGTLFDVLLIVLGFSAIIFVHELGHFLAARWAGIRVMAFAIGFGSAIVSFRKGLGLRRGSSEPEYLKLCALKAAGGLDLPADISPTEYRLNWLPFGGYVKMLGQDDANPGAVSSESDSYSRCVPWKRMIVISAGVTMNLISAAVLFIIVFNMGLAMMPAKIGTLELDGPAATAVAVNAKAAGVTEPGLHHGDVILSINGEQPASFNDLMLATSMAHAGESVELVVERPGVKVPLQFNVVPREGRLSGLLEIGVEPPRSAKLPRLKGAAIAEFEDVLAKAGLPGVKGGMTLTRAGGRAVGSASDFVEAFRESDGKPVALEFADDAGKTVTATLTPRPQLQLDLVPGIKGSVVPVEHLLGLTPVMTVGADKAKAGLEKGDIFARVGAVEFPGLSSGIFEIRAASGKTIDLVVLRGADLAPVKIVADVDRKGVVGFYPGTTGADSAILAMPFAKVIDPRKPEATMPTPASRIITQAGTRVISVGGRTVTNFGQIRAALLDATRDDLASGAESRVAMELELPGPGSVRTNVEWRLSLAEVAELHKLSWQSPISSSIFDMEEFILQEKSPAGAVSRGLHETRRVILNTYVTFARLFQGTVKVEHLKGPVGITALGAAVASKGFAWVLFFLALISVNLAVVNFLPLPIVDGGQFLFIVYEQFSGRPVPVSVQNATGIVGLVLIGAMFLVVTFNDLKNVFGL